jgi:hypothetical protein
MGRKYCVYTSNLTGSTGISFIMSPASAAAALPLLSSDNPLDNFLTRSQANLSTSPPYKVVDFERKGKGLIATRAIAKFETVMVDQASVVVELDMEKMVGKEVARGLLKRAVERLRVPKAVLGLSVEHAKGTEADAERGEQGKREEDVLLTNGFGSRVGDTDCRALFPLISVRISLPLNDRTRSKSHMEIACTGLFWRLERSVGILLLISKLCFRSTDQSEQTAHQPRLQPKHLRPLLPRRHLHGRKSVPRHRTRRRTLHLVHHTWPAVSPAPRRTRPLGLHM